MVPDRPKTEDATRILPVEAVTLTLPSGADVPAAGPRAAEAGPERDAPPGYQILGELGRGGMGVVYKARDLALNRVVALKMILSGGHAGADELKRFHTEAEAIARVQHPGIVQVFEVGSHEGRPFMALELCTGGSLEKKMAGGPLRPREAAEMVRKAALAVQAAHEAQVLHRDIKPANILLTADGSPKVTDFGLARKLDEQSETRTGSIMGTPSYMAPEQAEGKKEVGPAADTYALGAVLYECLTGRPPFKAATLLDTIQQVVGAEPVSARRLNARIPADLETVAMKCLQKRPQNRYASAGALADDLGRYLDGEPILARPPGMTEQVLRWCGRNPTLIALGLVWVLVLVFYLAVRGGVEQHLGATRAVGQDSVPSILAAERIKAALAAMHGTAANHLLHAPGRGRAEAEYETRRREATEGVLAATGNVTYGEAERAPLRRLLNGLGAYEAAVGRAAALHARGEKEGAAAQYRLADEIMRGTCLSAADALGRVNGEALERVYAAMRTSSMHALAGVLSTGLVLLGVLVAVQWLAARRTGRRLNVCLAAATLATAGLLVLSVVALAGQEGALKRARGDAFNSLHVLWQARAAAADADGDQSRWLLDRRHAATHEKAFRDRMALLARRPAGVGDEELLAAAERGTLPEGFEGHLAEELRNITYAGEREGAVSALRACLECMTLGRTIRALEAKGRHEEAVRLCLSEGDGGAGRAFGRLDDALAAVIAINQAEFDLALGASDRELSRVQYAAPLAAFAVALLAFFGLQPRRGQAAF